MYCIKEQGIPFDSKRYTPCLLLENSRDDALKFQQMVVRFNELYPGNKRIVYDACETFTIPDSIFAYTIYSGFIAFAASISDTLERPHSFILVIAFPSIP